MLHSGKNRVKFILVWIVIYGLSSCAPAKSTVTQAVITAYQIADVVINPRQPNQVVLLKIGQVLQVTPPRTNMEWQINYNPILLELLTPPDMIQAPGPEGWLFRAAASGEGQIVMTSMVSCPKPPCPLMPMRFQLSIQIK